MAKYITYMLGYYLACFIDGIIFFSALFIWISGLAPWFYKTYYLNVIELLIISIILFVLCLIMYRHRSDEKLFKYASLPIPFKICLRLGQSILVAAVWIEMAVGPVFFGTGLLLPFL